MKATLIKEIDGRKLVYQKAIKGKLYKRSEYSPAYYDTLDISDLTFQAGPFKNIDNLIFMATGRIFRSIFRRSGHCGDIVDNYYEVLIEDHVGWIYSGHLTRVTTKDIS